MSEAAVALNEPAPLKQRCPIAELFDANFIELLQLAPRNPHLRALILKFTGKLPPPERESYETLQEWLELNCEKQVKPKPTVKHHEEEGGIIVNVDFSETEYGRADYSVRRYGSGEFRVPAAELLDIIEEAIRDGGGLDDIVSALAEKVDSEAWEQCEPDLGDYGEYDYGDCDANSTEDSETEYSRNEIRNTVLRYLQQQHPELAAEL